MYENKHEHECNKYIGWHIVDCINKSNLFIVLISHVCRWFFFLCHFLICFIITKAILHSVFLPQTKIRKRDDPCFVHESFSGPRRRPSTVPAHMGVGAAHKDRPVKPRPTMHLWRAIYTRYLHSDICLSVIKEKTYFIQED